MSTTPETEAWEIQASAPLVFLSGRILYPTRVVCGESLVGELALTLPQLDRFALALGLRRLGTSQKFPGADASRPWIDAAPVYTPVGDRARLLDRIGGEA